MQWVTESAICPVCRRRIAITSGGRVLGAHGSQRDRCPGMGTRHFIDIEPFTSKGSWYSRRLIVPTAYRDLTAKEIREHCASMPNPHAYTHETYMTWQKRWERLTGILPTGER